MYSRNLNVLKVANCLLVYAVLVEYSVTQIAIDNIVVA